MLALGYLLGSLAGCISILITFCYWLLIARIVISWVSADPRNPIVQFIYYSTEPVLSRVRGKIPPIGMMDLSPILVFVLLYFIDSFLVGLMRDYGQMIVTQAKAG
jgi:YggT family protein